jgi:hypothetical protein
MMVQPGMGKQEEERKELEGNQNGRIARRDSRLGIFIHHPIQNENDVRRRREGFFLNYRSKYPGLTYKYWCKIGVLFRKNEIQT